MGFHKGPNLNSISWQAGETREGWFLNMDAVMVLSIVHIWYIFSQGTLPARDILFGGLLNVDLISADSVHGRPGENE